MERARLLLALLAPTLIVALAIGPVADLRVAFLAYVFGGCLLLPRWLVGAGRSPSLPFRGEHDRPVHWLIAGLLFGPVFLLVYWCLRQWITAPEPYLQALVELGWNDAYRPWYFGLFLVCVPLAEEWWWRGQALPRAERLFGRPAGIVLVALGFAGYHVPVLLRLYPTDQALLRIAGIVVAGFVWTVIAARRRSWGWVWWAHLAADAVIVVAFALWVAPQS